MSYEFEFTVQTQRFDENYAPSASTRLTTNFANLARGPQREENLKNTLGMIRRRMNALAPWDNPDAVRYDISVDIVTVDLTLNGQRIGFPIIEVLKTTLTDQLTGRSLDGICGNSFSSYLRDYDFSLALPRHKASGAPGEAPEQFGELHGRIFKTFLASEAWRNMSRKAPVICLSVSTKSRYRRTANRHPVLGVEYVTDAASLTDQYFAQMGLRVRYFLAEGSMAPLAFYFSGDLLNDYSNLELAGTIATMESFQRIYRPEIYNANAAAGENYRADLTFADHSLTRITYDRVERNALALAQAQLAEEGLIKPFGDLLAAVASRSAA